MSRHEPTPKEMMARREKEVRVVHAICAGVGGAVGAGYFFGTIGVIIGAIAGAAGGYATLLWRSGPD